MSSISILSVRERTAKLDNDRKAAIQKHGMHFGYPQCCIDSFASAVHSGGMLPSYRTRPKEQIDAAEHGFIPCLKHARQILAKQTTLAELILPSRQHSKAFPAKDYRSKRQRSDSTRFEVVAVDSIQASCSQIPSAKVSQGAQ